MKGGGRNAATSGEVLNSGSTCRMLATSSGPEPPPSYQRDEGFILANVLLNRRTASCTLQRPSSRCRGGTVTSARRFRFVIASVK